MKYEINEIITAFRVKDSSLELSVLDELSEAQTAQAKRSHNQLMLKSFFDEAEKI